MQILSMQRNCSMTGSTSLLDDGLWKSYQKQMTYQKVGKELGEEMVSNAGEAAFAGRTKDDVYYASPEAYNWFLGKLHKIYH